MSVCLSARITRFLWHFVAGFSFTFYTDWRQLRLHSSHIPWWFCSEVEDRWDIRSLSGRFPAVCSWQSRSPDSDLCNRMLHNIICIIYSSVRGGEGDGQRPKLPIVHTKKLHVTSCRLNSFKSRNLKKMFQTWLILQILRVVGYLIMSFISNRA